MNVVRILWNMFCSQFPVVTKKKWQLSTDSHSTAAAAAAAEHLRGKM
jgi:hypothetical protein